MSGGHGGQLDERIVAQRSHGFQRHVAGALDGPFVVLLEEDGTDEPDDGLIIGEDADDLGKSVNITVANTRSTSTSLREPVRNSATSSAMRSTMSGSSQGA